MTTIEPSLLLKVIGGASCDDPPPQIIQCNGLINFCGNQSSSQTTINNPPRATPTATPTPTPTPNATPTPRQIAGT